MHNMKGQTMIEVIIALTLIILFLSGIVVVELFAVKNSDYSRSKSISTQLARQQIERARVVSDTAGIAALDSCTFPCYINDQLTPGPPLEGIYSQMLTISDNPTDECPLPESEEITPIPLSYKVTALVSWAQGNSNITPAPEVEVSSCITDWR